MFESTADKVLRVLIDSEDKITVTEKISAIKIALPSLSDAEIDSVIAQLSREDLIVARYGGDELCFLRAQPHARSRLMTKREFFIWNIKWDVAKIALGYTLGFVSALLLK